MTRPTSPARARLTGARPRRTTLVAAACLTAAVTSGCDSGGSAGGSSGAPRSADAAPSDGAASEAPAADVMSGTWDYCAGGFRSTYVFSGGRYDQYIAYFLEAPDCSGAPSRELDISPDEVYTSGTYALRGEITTAQGVTARQLDTDLDTILGEPVLESLRFPKYDIVHTAVPGQLIFGTFAADTPDERPTTLDFDRLFLRR